MGGKTEKTLQGLLTQGATVGDLAAWPLAVAARDATAAGEGGADATAEAAALSTLLGVPPAPVAVLLQLELAALGGEAAEAGAGLRLKTVADLADWKFLSIAVEVMHLAARDEALEALK